MAEFRFLLYGIGFIASVMVVAQLLRLRVHPLGRMLVFMMAIWAVNCAVLLASLASLEVTGHAAPWLFTANAALLAVGPLALLVWFLRQNGRSR